LCERFSEENELDPAHVLSSRRPPGDVSELLSPLASFVTGPDRRHRLLQ
jgi:hypothetical protein